MGKLVKIDNVHLPLFAIGSGTGETFDTRPVLQNDPTAGYNYSRFGELNAAQPNTAPYTNLRNFHFGIRCRRLLKRKLSITFKKRCSLVHAVNAESIARTMSAG